VQLYVGSLPVYFTDRHLHETFEPFGNVVYSTVLMDHATVRERLEAVTS
jgi:hypothetical protein